MHKNWSFVNICGKSEKSCGLSHVIFTDVPRMYHIKTTKYE